MCNKIIIRSAALEDAEQIWKIYAFYVENTAITFEYETPALSDFRKRIEKIQERYPYLVAEQNGEVLGYAYAGKFKERAAFDWAVETTVYVKQGKQKLGIGKKLYTTLEACLKAQGILNLNACIAYPIEEPDLYLSKDSVIFHEKMGYHMAGRFHKCGYKFRHWYDVVWMEKHIGEHQVIQSEVMPFREVKWKE